MSREILNESQATPNPDGPHAAGSNRGSRAEAGTPSQTQDDSAIEEPNYDSCFDDLDMKLSEPISEPDPALKSKSSSDTIPETSSTFLQSEESSREHPRSSRG